MTILFSNPMLTRIAIGTSVLVALLLWESWKPFFPFFAGAGRRRRKHLARNLSVGLLNAALTVLFFSTLWRKGAAWSTDAGLGILDRIAMPMWLHAGAAILLLDIWTYWWHRANHRLAFLWRFHRMHHSDPELDVTSARRFHPGEIAMSSILRAPLIVVLGIHLWELAFYELLMGMVVDFHHANVALPERFDRLLRTLLVTPAMHKVHHSRIRLETDSNYTSLLSLWDRVFGSFRLQPALSAIQIGLDGWSESGHQTLPGMLATPLRNHPNENKVIL